MTNEIEPRAFRPREFCRRNGIGLTTFYALLNEGKLKARKIGNATIVLADDEAAWLASLPEISGKTA
jgi:predicted site-specific integrase-resolvase